jgi:hypothetical protein
MGNSVVEDGLCVLILRLFLFWGCVFWGFLACFGGSIVCEYG